MPESSATLSQFELHRYLSFFVVSTFSSSYFLQICINLLNSLTFVSLLTHRPNHIMKELHVGALIISVKKAHPAMLKILIERNFSGRKSFEAKMRVKAIPTAPRKPP